MGARQHEGGFVLCAGGGGEGGGLARVGSKGTETRLKVHAFSRPRAYQGSGLDESDRVSEM